MSADTEALEVRLDYRFHDRNLLRRALTHKSRVYEQNLPEVIADNEQMEFLGDSVLGFLVSEKLVREFPAFPEGRLSKLKAHLVSATHLHRVAQALDLGDYLLLGRGEEMSGGRHKKALLANAIEAIIAAIYFDGGIEAARAFVLRHVIAGFDLHQEAGGDTVSDYKSALQEMAQVRKLPPPRYHTLEERGPEHAKTFLVEVRVGRDFAGQAEGLSKKSAGQEAARLVLLRIRDSEHDYP